MVEIKETGDWTVAELEALAVKARECRRGGLHLNTDEKWRLVDKLTEEVRHRLDRINQRVGWAQDTNCPGGYTFDAIVDEASIAKAAVQAEHDLVLADPCFCPDCTNK